KAHARNALSRVSQHGSPAEKKRVRAAVRRKYPSIGKKKRTASRKRRRGGRRQKRYARSQRFAISGCEEAPVIATGASLRGDYPTANSATLRTSSREA